jgi:hypothetical protein
MAHYDVIGTEAYFDTCLGQQKENSTNHPNLQFAIRSYGKHTLYHLGNIGTPLLESDSILGDAPIADM